MKNSKKHFLLIISLFITSISIAQDNYEAFFKSLQIENQITLLIEQHINSLKQSRSDVPLAKWNEIKSQIEYRSYIEKMQETVKKYYSEQEIEKILIESNYKNTRKIKHTPKPQLMSHLFRIGKEFARDMNLQIRRALGE